MVFCNGTVLALCLCYGCFVSFAVATLGCVLCLFWSALLFWVFAGYFGWYMLICVRWIRV